MKRVFLGILAALFLGFPLECLGGCLAGIQARGVLTAGTDSMGLRPYMWQNKDGTYSGFEADLLAQVSRRIGVPSVHYAITEFTSLIPGLVSKRWDVAISGISATQQRLKAAEISFSRPYLLLYHEMIVNGASPIHCFGDMKEARVGAHLGTNDSLNAHRLSLSGEIGEVLDFNGAPDAFLALHIGRVDAVLADQLTVRAHQEKMKNCRVVGEPMPMKPSSRWRDAESRASYIYGTTSVVVHRQCDDLLAAINNALIAMDQDGTREAIFRQYGVWSPEQTVLTK